MAKTLLLADDSVTIQKVVGISFAGEDVDLVTVDNGDDAIEKAREIRPDVVLSDVVMPGKNGYEVCEAIKTDPNLAHIPVLLLTGTFEAFDEERASRCGAAGHVAKPFEAQTLVDRVHQLLANPQPAPAAPAAPAPQASASTVIGQTPVAPQAHPAAAPQAPPAAAPAPSAGDSINDSSFEFFDEEVAAPAAPAAAAPPPLAEPAAPVSLDPTDSSFAFGEDEPAAPAGDRTVAMMPDAPPAPPAQDDLLPPPIEPPSADEAFDFESSSFGESDLLAPLSEAELGQETVLDPKGASGYDVSSSDLRDPQVSAPDVSLPPEPVGDAATVMVSPEPAPAAPAAPDPATVGAELFSDDLQLDDPAPPPSGRETVLDTGEPLMAPPAEAMAPPPPPVPEPIAPTPEPVAAPAPPPPVVPEPSSAPSQALMDAFEEPDPFATPEPIAMPEPDAFAEPMPEPTVMAPPEPVATPQPEPAPMPMAAPEPDIFAEPAPPAPEPEPVMPPAPEPMLEPVMAPEPLAEPDVFAEPAPPLAEPEPALDSRDMAGVALASIEPQLREQLHDTLEKIAWESFGDVTDQIVRKAVERVEQVAWEVIPQMAETLIREEIKKLKGDG